MKKSKQPEPQTQQSNAKHTRIPIGSTKANNCYELREVERVDQMRERKKEREREKARVSESDWKPAADRGTGAREKVARSERLRILQSPNISLDIEGHHFTALCR